MTREEAERLLLLAREAQLVGPEAPEWIERLGPKREEMVEAVGWLAANGEQEAAAELAAGVWRLWLLSGDVAGGRQMLAAALDLDHPKPSRARALALYADGLLAFRQGAQADSLARNDEALTEARALGDTQAEALALVGLSRVALAFATGDRAAAADLVRRTQETLDKVEIVLDPDDAFEVRWLSDQLR